MTRNTINNNQFQNYNLSTIFALKGYIPQDYNPSYNLELKNLLESLIHISKKASKIIMKIYEEPDFDVRIKDDGSPLTRADEESNSYIYRALKEILNIPIISEEGNVPCEIRQRYDFFWLVDPLDGTKDFIDRNDEFTINISLILKETPIIGVISAPAKQETFYAVHGLGSYYMKEDNIYKLPLINNKKVIAVKSRFHDSDETEYFIRSNKITDVKEIGSSLKFCYLAKGDVTIYPRYQGSKEWDIAAGHIILKEAGGDILDLTTKEEPKYNKKKIRNNYFVAYAGNINIEDYF